jgi:hypothetical protein
VELVELEPVAEVAHQFPSGVPVLVRLGFQKFLFRIYINLLQRFRDFVPDFHLQGKRLCRSFQEYRYFLFEIRRTSLGLIFELDQF